MRVAIDLGEIHTQLACWQDDQDLDNPIINVRIPGRTVFNPDPSQTVWDPLAVRAYLSHLQQEYLLPSRQTVASVALAVPYIMPLDHRADLLGIVEEVLGMEGSIIIPRPLAMAAGYNLRHPSAGLRGDVLLVDVRETRLDLALLSISDPGGIILERQCNSVRPQARQELGAGASWDEAGWQFASVLVAGQPISRSELEDCLYLLPGKKEVICESDLDFCTVEALWCTSAVCNPDSANRLSLIYPYEFWLAAEATADTPAAIHKIPFDTNNLELAYAGRYSLVNLADFGLGETPGPSARLKLRIYELPAGSHPDQEATLDRAYRVLELDSPREDLPAPLIIILDMAQASLHLQLAPLIVTVPSPGSEILRRRLSANQDQLLHLLRSQGRHKALVHDWEDHLASRRPESSGLADQLQSTLFKLYALSNLWREL